MTVAQVVEPVVRAALGGRIPIGICCWDGSRVGPDDAVMCVHVARRRALRRLLWAPGELGMARAYVSGDIEVEGDLLAGVGAVEEATLSAGRTEMVVDAATTRQ